MSTPRLSVALMLLAFTLATTAACREPEHPPVWKGCGCIPDPPSDCGPACRGEIWFRSFCEGCHLDRDSDLGPSLVGLWGEERTLANGRTVHARKDYVWDAIVFPEKQRPIEWVKVNVLSPPITFQEGMVEDLIAFVESLSDSSAESDSGLRSP